MSRRLATYISAVARGETPPAKSDGEPAAASFEATTAKSLAGGVTEKARQPG